MVRFALSKIKAINMDFKKLTVKREDKCTIHGVSNSYRHPKCAGIVEHTMNGTEYSCGYETTIDCSECKYNVIAGKKDPEAKCNQ